MAFEIERKFLILNDAWQKDVTQKFDIVQGYLSRDKERTVRVRISDDRAYLTIKGKKTGMTAAEFEYEIPKADAIELLKSCLPGTVEKTRHIIPLADGRKWEIDVFKGANTGLIMAEIELKSENDAFDRPAWLGAEVTQDSRYSNAALSTTPFSGWGKPPVTDRKNAF